MAEKKLVKQVAIKQDNGSMGTPYKVGASFEEIIDERKGKGNYTLAQFFDNYLEFMKNTTFVYEGPTKPENQHIGIWIDTSKTNQD